MTTGAWMEGVRLREVEIRPMSELKKRRETPGSIRDRPENGSLQFHTSLPHPGLSLGCR